MDCPHCQTLIPDASTFCLHCGKRTPKPTAPENKESSSANRTALVVVILAIVAIGALVMSSRESNRILSVSTTGFAQQTATSNPTPIIPQWQHIVDGPHQ